MAKLLNGMDWRFLVVAIDCTQSKTMTTKMDSTYKSVTKTTTTKTTTLNKTTTMMCFFYNRKN